MKVGFAGGLVWAGLFSSLLQFASAGESQLLRTESGFPGRPIRLVVYTSPGGLIDTTAREFARIARRHFSEQPIVVINRPGAGGIVAFEEVLQMPADGHHLLAVTRSNISKLVATRREDLIERIDWHSYLMDNAHVVITNVAEGVTSWQDVVEAAQQRGNSVWVGVDIGGVKHVSGVKVGQQSGIEVRWIPFSSGGQAVAALLGGMGTAYLGNPRDAVGRPDLRVVAVAASQRLKDFPEAPTFAEMGIAGLEGERIWRGLALRQGVPEEVREWLAELVRRVVHDPEWAAVWEGEGLNLQYAGAEEFSRMVQEDREEFRYYLREMGLLRERGRDGGLWAPLLSGTGLQLFLAFLIAVPILLTLALSGEKGKPLRGEAVAVSLFLGFAALLFILSRGLPPASAVDPVGATGVPLLWIGLLVPLGFYQVWVLRRGTAGAPALPVSPRGLLFAALLIGYALAMPRLGYFPATGLFLPLGLLCLGVSDWRVVAGVSGSWLVFAYIVFQRILYVDLPRGLIPF